MPSLFSRLSEERTPRKSGPQRPPPGSRFSLAPKLEEDEDGLTDPLTGSDTKQEDDNLPTPMRPIVSPEERQVRTACINSTVLIMKLKRCKRPSLNDGNPP